jgi:hypothetical protein
MTQDLQQELRTLKQELHDTFDTLKISIELQTLRLTVRFGVMMMVWVAAAAAILKPAHRPHSWLNCLF